MFTICCFNWISTEKFTDETSFHTYGMNFLTFEFTYFILQFAVCTFVCMRMIILFLSRFPHLGLCGSCQFLLSVVGFCSSYPRGHWILIFAGIFCYFLFFAQYALISPVRNKRVLYDQRSGNTGGSSVPEFC